MTADIKNDVIWVTGADGQLGRAFSNIINKYTNSYFLTDIEQVDITDVDTVLAFTRKNKITTIINCSAYTNVDKAQYDCQNLRKVNVLALRNLLCTKCRIIHFSSDYVYSGVGNTSWKEDDELHPLNYYGISKLISEKFITGAFENGDIPAYITLRISNLWSSNKSARLNIISKFVSMLENNQYITAFTDCYFRPTYAETLAEQILSTILPKLSKETSGIYNYSNSGDIQNVYNIVQFIANKLGVSNKLITPTLSTDINDSRRADRPKYTILDTKKIEKTFDLDIPTWENTISMYIQNRK